ncbi:hypothetical protein OHA37_21715 [Streptomyces sp. NBC_00335]|uniref:hypothetical protein n=1 Tax=unclassified Streptomyces TaxID=2593676 RepID=UPI0022557AE0|nr:MULTISPECIES: hypothetical protein [unclassified Streptomyces]MCX5406480.1 hypothetical protein [Streptomyces sp. NBC_00086]
MVVTGRRVRLTAVLVGVVLALTGFSSTSSSGKSKSSGGGCSSSKSKSKTKTKSYGSGSTGGSGSGSGSTATATPTPSRPLAHAEVVTCAGPSAAKATVKVTSDASAAHTFRVPLVFEGASGRVDSGSVDLALKAGESRTVDLTMTSAAEAGEVRRCTLGTIQTLSTASPTPTSTATSGSSGSTTSGSTGGKTTSKPKPRSTRKTR